MSPWFVYIIENRLGQFYTGISNDLPRRLNEHQSSGPKCAKALRGKGPLTLKFFYAVDNHSAALKTEIWIKKLTKSQKNSLVEQRFDALLFKDINMQTSATSSKPSE